jgi:acetyl coenzyme A synthetase (ADP forming)-like protein
VTDKASGSPEGPPGRPGGAPGGRAQADPGPLDPEGVDVLLADGSTARVRPIRPEDGPAVVELHGRLSKESVVRRYFGAHPRLSDEEVARLTRSGDPDHLALVAERAGRLVGIAQYDRTVGADEAEVAFVVDDAFQGRGVGTLLLEHLAAAGRRHGIRRFVADTMADNHRMLSVFRNVGFARRSSLEHGIVHVVLDIAPSEQALEAADQRDRLAVVQSMRRLLRPGSVAVIGASRTPGTIGHELVRNLVAGGFQGPVYPVNPNARHVASLPCWPSVEALPAEIDLAVVAVPAPAVPDVVEACGRKGVGALVVVSSGFAETGPEGAAAERAVVRLAHAYGMRLVGPNCFGVLETDPAVSLNATFAPVPPLPGRVGFVSQSGGLGIAILGEARARGLGLSSFVSMGNKADVSGNDLLTWWEQDPRTDVALLYLESFGNPRKFARLARRISRTKPIVVVKAGRSGPGRAAASSHTAALASPDQAVDALVHQTGAIRVDTIEELFDVAEVLVHQPLPTGRRLGILTNAGGPGVLAADAAAGLGLVVAPLSIGTEQAIRASSPSAAAVSNPVDLGAAASAEAYERCLGVLLRSGEVDAVLVIFTPPLVTGTEEVARAVVRGADASTSSVPVLVSLLGTTEGRAALRAGRRPVPCFTYPETALRALAHAVRHAEWRARPKGTVPALDRVDANAARRLLEGAEAWVTGTLALSVLAAYGLAVAPTEEATTADAAAEAAKRFGFPVALKAHGPGLLHKADVGGVRLGLRSPEEVAAAFEAMHAALGATMSGALVQPMAETGAETIIGFVRDRAFGPQVLFGLGGTAVELLGDHVVRLAPLTDVEAAEMVRGLKGSPLLLGYRGSTPVDLDALVDALLRVSRLADDLPEIAELDANPVVATPSGALVLDARLRVEPHAVPAEGAELVRRLR